ncbi:MAG: hypothetical protein U0074_01020 [Kouleothrix sp.]
MPKKRKEPWKSALLSSLPCRAAAGHITALAGTTTVVLLTLLRQLRPDPLGFAVCRNRPAIWPRGMAEEPTEVAHEPYTGYQVAGTDARHAPFQQFH